MRIGITFDLKTNAPPTPPSQGGDCHSSPPFERGAGGVAPDDAQEEFDSPATIEAIAGVLGNLGHDVVKLGDGRGLLERLLADPPDFVFNFAEGQGISRSREARVPAVLEMLGIPYSGSDPLTLAVTLDKPVAKQVMKPCDELYSVPWDIVIPPDRDPLECLKPMGFPFPAIVKPAWEGSSKGIRNKCVLESADGLPAIVREMRRHYQQPILLEEYISGDELTVGVIGNDRPTVIGVMRVVPVTPTERFVYGLEVKRDFRRQVRYECPPPYSAHCLGRIEEAALEVFRKLGCRDVARIDFRLEQERGLFFLEANPLPGLHPEDSDLVILAKGMGWSYERLISTILEAALRRHGLGR
jgi:D-alanine-D-alanine ligase